MAYRLLSSLSNNGCLPSSFFSPRAWVSQLVFIKCWIPKEIDCNAHEEMYFSVRVRASRPREQASFFHVLYRGCHQKLWSRLKVDLPNSEDPDQRWVFPLQTTSKKNPSQCTQSLGFQLIPDVGKLTTKTSRHVGKQSLLAHSRH